MMLHRLSGKGLIMRIVLGLTVSLILSACASAVAMNTDMGKSLMLSLKEDFSSKGPATVERLLNQDEVQKACSVYPLEITKRESMLENQFKTVKFPADGVYLGDWKEGEKIAQNGRGLQSSDPINSVNGGNCYACHQLSKQEISFGNIGPSLYRYGARGTSEETVKYTWAKIYNSQAFTICSNMPRFGHSGILTEKQIKDVMALLFDKNSPVNE